MVCFFIFPNSVNTKSVVEMMVPSGALLTLFVWHYFSLFTTMLRFGSGFSVLKLAVDVFGIIFMS